MAEYQGSIELISGLIPKNNQDFPLVSAHHVQVDNTGKRLDLVLQSIDASVLDRIEAILPDLQNAANFETYNTLNTNVLSIRDNLVLAQETQPESEDNRIWIKPTNDEYLVPSYEELQDVKKGVSNLLNEITDVKEINNLLVPMLNTNVDTSSSEAHQHDNHYSAAVTLQANHTYMAYGSVTISNLTGYTAGAIALKMFGSDSYNFVCATKKITTVKNGVHEVYGTFTPTTSGVVYATLENTNHPTGTAYTYTANFNKLYLFDLTETEATQAECLAVVQKYNYSGILYTTPGSYQNLAGEVTNLKSALTNNIETGLSTKNLKISASPEGWKLLDNGLCASDSSAKLVKYQVITGKMYKIVSDYKAQFQNSASVPSSGSSNRVGITYGIGTFYVVAPSNATYLIISTSKTGSTADAYEMVNSVPANFFTPYSLNWTSGKCYNSSGDLITVSDYSATTFNVSAFRGETITGTVGLVPNGYAIGFKDDNGVLIESYQNTTAGTYRFDYTKTIPNNASTMFLSNRNASEDIYSAPEVTYNAVFRKFEEAYGYGNNISNIEKLVEYQMELPQLRNGSVGNTANGNMVATKYVIPINHNYRFMRVDFILDESLADAYAFTGCLFKGATDGMSTSAAMLDSSVTKLQFNQNATETQAVTYKYFDIASWADYDHVSLAAWRSKDGTAVPIRIATNPKAIRIAYFSAPGEYDHTIVENKNARHIKGNTATPLTLLHFSDLHKDTSALARIMSEAKDMVANIDDAICTGDMVLNSAEQIESWWDASVMTCIGNHDAASYSDGTYDWTALSMANRDAYYIAPFESKWGITHESGKSYYYKDYATQKIRMIVLDTMLYTDNGQDATDQTIWLEGLLADTLDSEDSAYGYHVLIATHAPYGYNNNGVQDGARSVSCSFSKYFKDTPYIMPEYSDCNTPKAVIDVVSTKITAGMKFIGYLCGHTHQDNIWDAKNDGTQLMYCITCGIVSQNAQWKNSDQYRGNDADAYNLVTIDTANTLIKIVRGGGADIDDHMRTRKAICFNYSTGEKVGEVL